MQPDLDLSPAREPRPTWVRDLHDCTYVPPLVSPQSHVPFKAGPSYLDPRLSPSTDFTFHVPRSACYQGDEDRAHDYQFPADDILLMRDSTDKGILLNCPRLGHASYNDDDLVSVLSDLTDLDKLERLAVSHQHVG